MHHQEIGRAIKHYHQIDERSGVESASPHRLIQMLLAGALSRIATAQNHMKRQEIAKKGEQISAAISIIEGLRASLDLDRGGEIAANLEQLYDYMSRRLVQANARNDSAMLSEIQGLLREIRSGWDGITATSQGTAAATTRSELKSAKSPRINIST
ncbi:MAG: flagellar export chaperone FliS [Gammaproteobacteria bacterium]